MRPYQIVSLAKGDSTKLTQRFYGFSLSPIMHFQKQWKGGRRRYSDELFFICNSAPMIFDFFFYCKIRLWKFIFCYEKKTTLTKKTGKVYFSSPRFFSGDAFIGIRSRKNLKHKIGKQYFWWSFFLVISEFKIKYLNTIMFILIFRNIRGTVFIMPQTQL